MATAVQGYEDFPVKDVQDLHATLHAENASRRLHPMEQRLYLLKRLGYVIQDNRKAISDSLYRDLGRSQEENEMGEIIGILKEVQLAVKRLPEWMADESCKRDTPLLFKLNNPKVRKQPKGPVLIVGPWNYPWLLNVGPLIGAIAAGCPAVLKPSEHSPHSSALLAKLIHEDLDDPAYRVVLGDVEQSKALLDLRWGHIFFTGSPAIGRQVAAAAAKNLVPCTMELGGKCPVIIAPDANLKIAARRVLSVKTLGSGQMCTNADYVLCPKHLVNDLMKTLEETLHAFFPDPLNSPNVSRMINHRGFERAVKSLEQARAAGKTIIGGQVDEEQNKMAPAVVLLKEGAKEEDTNLVQEEIFGPILPVIPVENLDTAIAYVNARDHPLALYVFSSKKSTYDYVIDRTLSGGSCWNDVGVHVMQRGLPFGGVGESGYGAGHGRAFFESFTHRRSMIEIPYHLEPIMALRYPAPTPDRIRLLLRLLGTTLSFKRSKSPADERPRGLFRRASPWVLILALVALAARRFS